MRAVPQDVTHSFTQVSGFSNSCRGINQMNDLSPFPFVIYYTIYSSVENMVSLTFWTSIYVEKSCGV